MMEYNFTEEELSIKDTISKFAKKEIAPFVDQIEKEGRMPEALLSKIKALKISGLPFHEDLGGAGGTIVGDASPEPAQHPAPAQGGPGRECAFARTLNRRAFGHRIRERHADLDHVGAGFRQRRHQLSSGLHVRIAGGDEGDQRGFALLAQSLETSVESTHVSGSRPCPRRPGQLRGEEGRRPPRRRANEDFAS